MIFAGYSLRSGVASLLTMILVNHRDEFGGASSVDVSQLGRQVCRRHTLCRAAGLSLISLLLLMDDCLPRTATPLEDIFKSLFWWRHSFTIIHYGMLRLEGAQGMIIVAGKKLEPFKYDYERSILREDWYHKGYLEQAAGLLSSPLASNGLESLRYTTYSYFSFY
ncbi:unnamed protein product [Cuscuta epithymum]|uniref:Uncharacterized protein n=1 Tax=Cuscuta epithymum TaxID=186058 RepID=A0AAV0FMQ7_9ASTE|nr:unnamed protein product [Cuscuta epithymum]